MNHAAAGVDGPTRSGMSKQGREAVCPEGEVGSGLLKCRAKGIRGPEAIAAYCGRIAPTFGSASGAADFTSIVIDGVIGRKKPELPGSVDANARF